MSKTKDDKIHEKRLPRTKFGANIGLKLILKIILGMNLHKNEKYIYIPLQKTKKSILKINNSYQF